MLMPGTSKRAFLLIGLLTVINAGLLLFNEKFDYKPYADESRLYAPPSSDQFRFFTDFPREGRQRAIQFIDSLLRGGDTARLTEIQKVATFLYHQFATQLGKPDAGNPYHDPWEMYRYYSGDSTRKLWCGHLAILFNYFCLARGIETRMIEIMKPGDHHVVNECYLPGSRKWVLVDITYNQLLVSASEGERCSLAGFRKLQGLQRMVKVQAADDSSRIMRMDTGYIRNYYSQDIPAYYYKTVNPAVVYSNPAKFRRYILPESWYSILSLEQSSNILFYIRQVLLIAWVLSLIYLLMLGYRKIINGWRTRYSSKE